MGLMSNLMNKEVKIAKALNEAVRVIGSERNGNLEHALYEFVRRYNPMLCVDVVLVPEDEKPSVIMARRGNKAVAPGQWWVFGGRIDKELDYFSVARAKVKSEIGLDVDMHARDIIGLGRTYFPPDAKEIVLRNYDISTPNICLAKQVPITEQARAKIQPADGHEPVWKIFNGIDEDWHPYVINAVAYAWKRIYGIRAEDSVPASRRDLLANQKNFIPLCYEA